MLSAYSATTGYTCAQWTICTPVHGYAHGYLGGCDILRKGGSIVASILITTSTFGKDDPSPLRLLEDAGYEAITNPYARKLTEEEVLNPILGAKPVGMIAGVEPITSGNSADSLKIMRLIEKIYRDR